MGHRPFEFLQAVAMLLVLSPSTLALGQEDTCSEDSDCAANQTCVEQTSAGCNGSTGDCASDDEECIKQESQNAAEDCWELKYYECVERWLLPCDVASDCGDGFECTAVQNCGCTGGTGASAGSDDGGVDSDEADSPTDAGTPSADSSGDEEEVSSGGVVSNCSCEPAGYGQCTLIPQICTSDSECPTGMTCDYTNEGCEDTPTEGGTPGGTGFEVDAGSDEGSQDSDEAAASSAQALCLQPVYCAPAGYAASVGGSQGDSGGETSNSGNENDEETAVDAGTGDDAPTSNADTDGTTTDDDSGCHIGGAAQGAMQTLWLGLPLLWMRRRRNHH